MKIIRKINWTPQKCDLKYLLKKEPDVKFVVPEVLNVRRHIVNEGPELRGRGLASSSGHFEKKITK